MPRYTDNKGKQRNTGKPEKPTKAFKNAVEKFRGLFIGKNGEVKPKFRKHLQKVDDRLEFRVKNIILANEPPGKSIHSVKVLLKKFSGQKVKVTLTEGGVPIKSVPYNVPHLSIINKWWNIGNKFTSWTLGGSEDNAIWAGFDDPRLIVVKSKDIEASDSPQVYSDNVDHNCLFKPIKNDLVLRLENATSARSIKDIKRVISVVDGLQKEYPSGVPQIGGHLEKICDTVKCTIRIFDMMYKLILEVEPSKSSRKIYQYMNTSLDHLDKMVNISAKHTEVVSRKEIAEEFKRCQDNLEDNEYIFKMGKEGIRELCTIDNRFITLEDVKYYELVGNFEKKNNLGRYNFKYTPGESFSEFLKSGIHFSTSRNFNRSFGPHEVLHIDGLRSYATPELTKFYQGFPMFCFKAKAPRKIIDVEMDDFLRLHVGFWEVRNFVMSERMSSNNREIFTTLNCFPKGVKVILTSPELRFLFSIGYRFTLVEGVWGWTEDLDYYCTEHEIILGKLSPGDLPTIPEFVEKKCYSKYFGQCASTKLEDTVSFFGEEKFACILKAKYPNTEYSEDRQIDLKIKRPHTFFKPALAAFTTAYSRIKTWEQLIEIPFDNIVRVQMDDIYYKKCDIKIRDGFREKPIDWLVFNDIIRYQSDSFVSYYNTSNESIATKGYSFLKKVLGDKVVLLKGPGGAGKGVFIEKLGPCLVSPLYTTMSWLLTSKKAVEYNATGSVTARLLGRGCENTFIDSNYNPVILDECTSLTDDDAKKVEELFPNKLIIYAGDLKWNYPYTYQMPCVGGETMKKRGKVINFPNNFRSKDDHQRKVCNDLRKIQDQYWAVEETEKWLRQHYPVINGSDALAMYHTDDQVIASQHIYCDDWTRDLSTLWGECKWLVKRNNVREKIYNGTVLIGDSDEISKETVKETRFGFTIHSCQGDTLKHKIFIDMRDLNNNLMYTAISRAHFSSQIFLVDYDQN